MTTSTKPKKRVQPSQRSKKLLEKEGWQVGMTERWNTFAGVPKQQRCPCGQGMITRPVGIRQDLWKFVDMVAVKSDKPGTLYVQSTVMDRLAEHVAKILNMNEAVVPLRAGNRIEVHGWVKRPITKARKREKWEVVRREIILLEAPSALSGLPLGWENIEEEDPF